MAKLSKLSRRLRRAFELENPAAQLDEFVVDFFARMLEDDADDDDDARVEELAEAWSPFLVEHAATFDNGATTREVCKAVIRRLHASDGLSGAGSPPQQLSRQSSLNQGLVGTATASSSASTPVCRDADPSDANQPASIEVWGLMEWLQRLSLVHYAAAAKAWCAGMGAADVEEVIEAYEDFCAALKLKPLETRRVRNDCQAGLAGDAARAPGAALAGGGAVRSAHVDAAADGSAASPPARGLQPLAPDGAEAGTALAGIAAAPRARAHRCGQFGPASSPYTILHEVGAGVTATVYKCTRGESVYAAKAITLSRFRMQRDFASEIEKLRRESEILYTLRHTHVVSLYDVVEAPDKLYLVMEFVEGGELFDRICWHGALAEHEARYVFVQIARGLRYIHSKGVVHRDLKPQNILIDRKASRPGLLEVKISDFGHSKLVNDGYDTARTQVGTPRYWAPEVAETSSRGARGYDQRVDLWSLGVVLFVMLEGRYPFDGCDDAVEVPFTDESTLSADARDLVRGLIQMRPQERLALDRCLAHPWVMLRAGPLSRIVRLLDDLQHNRRDERERRALLPRDPTDVQRLRRDLQELTLEFKFPARLRRREVALCFRSADRAAGVDAAWAALQAVLERHFPGEAVRRLDLECPAAGAALAPVDEAGCEADGDRAARADAAPDGLALARAAALEVQDAELSDLLAAAGPGGGPCCAWVVSAAIGEWGSTPRRVEFRLQEGPASLTVDLQLPPGYPGREAPELQSVVLRDPTSDSSAALDGTAQAVERRVRSGIQGRLAAPRGPCLLDFFAWLQEDQIFQNVGGNGLDSSAHGAPGSGSGQPVSVSCARVCKMIHHHDEKVDMSGMCTTRGGPLKRISFYAHVRSICGAEASGFVSFGKPAFLLVEGPLAIVERILVEVEKFPSWWDAQERSYHRHSVPDVTAWRVSREFARLRTEELHGWFDRAERMDLFEEIMAGTSMDPKKKASKGRHR